MAEGDEVQLDDLLQGFDDHVKTEFASMPEVEDVGDDLDLDKLAIAVRRWTRVNEIVAVVADMKDSTKLGTGPQRAASTASIYEAAMKPLVETFEEFSADDMAIQGDGAIGIFWGDRRFERAMCAGITVKTFSHRHLEKRLEDKWPDLPAETGFKVGVAASRILVKKIGIPRKPDHQEEVWAGKAVNYAAKSGQSADRHQLIVTGTVWDIVGKNDYIAISCTCNDGPSGGIWDDFTIDRLPEDEPERYGRKLKSTWCKIHGQEFCNAIMSGETKRPEAAPVRKEAELKGMASAIRMKAQKEREDRRNLRIARGLR